MKIYTHIIYTVVIAGLVIGLSYQLLHKPIKTENNVAQILKLEKQQPVISKDNLGQTHVEKEQIQLSRNNLALLLHKEIDSLKSQINLKDKLLLGLTTVKGEATHTFTPDIKTSVDSTNKIKADLAYTSTYFDLTGQLELENNKITSQLFRTKFRDSLSLIFTKQKYGFLNLKEKIVANAYSSNKDMSYSNIRSFNIPEPSNNKSKIGLGLTIGPGIQFSKDNKFTYGLQATVGLQFRF